MCKTVIHLIVWAWVVGLMAGVAFAKPLQQDSGPDGIVSVEAENYDANVANLGDQWVRIVGPKGGFTGAVGMQALPDDNTGQRTSNYAARSPHLDYQVNFAKTGTHYVWVRGYGATGSDDSCHVSFDGKEITTSDNMSGWNGVYAWSNSTNDGVRSSFDIPTTGLHTLNIWMREDGFIVDKIVLTTNPDYIPTGNGPAESMRGPRIKAFSPSPGDTATDVPRDVILNWTPGVNAVKHDVYFGSSSVDVNAASRTNPLNVLVGQDQDANSYDNPSLLEFGKTYYWRVDEVNAPPTSTVYRGDVWSFTVEPVVYSIRNVIATASSSHNANMGPEKTANGAGVNASDLHSITDTDMWLSNNAGPQPTWIKYEFDKAYKLHEMWVWNYNTSTEPIVGWGFKSVTVEYSTDNVNWTQLSGVPQFAQGTGAAGYAHNTTVSFGGVTAKYVRLTANSNWGVLTQYGLSEVRFYYMPVHARDPSPLNSQANVPLDTLLRWRAGREAATHKLYIGTGRQAVMDGTVAPINIPASGSTGSYGPVPLEMGKTYFWKVNEVNEAKTPSTWPGDIWKFTTQSYLIVDDFEDYNNSSPKRIFQTWIDGFGYSEPAPGNPGNGTSSAVGHDIWSAGTPYTNIMETAIIHGGKQAMPMDYNNIKLPYYSEAERTWTDSQDWTKGGAKALTLWFMGNPPAFMESGGKYIIGGSGSDIFGTSDQFRFVFKQLTGNGTIQAQVLSVQNADPWAKAGVMIRDTLDPTSKFAMLVMAPGYGCRFQIRTLTAGGATSDSTVTTLAAVRTPHWVKLERTGDLFKAYDSNDPATDGWHELVWGGQTISMQSTVYIGLCVTSHNVNATCVGEFSDVSTTGSVTGAAWKAQAIGATMASNTPEQLYVAVQDTGGKVKAAIHADPAATILNTYQEWNIPLKTFSDAGVNLKGVKKLYLGAGNRASPALGGAGSLYFDDIRLYPAQCLPAIGKPAADITGDCTVDFKDLDVMADQWLKTAPPALSADLNTDSKVDLKDFAKLAQGWLEEILWP